MTWGHRSSSSSHLVLPPREELALTASADSVTASMPRDRFPQETCAFLSLSGVEAPALRRFCVQAGAYKRHPESFERLAVSFE